MSEDKPDDRITLPADLAANVARAGVDPTLPRRDLRKALRRKAAGDAVVCVNPAARASSVRFGWCQHLRC